MKFPKLSPCLLHKQEKSDILLIIGADTIVILDGKILGKPNGYDGAFEMLKSLSGKTHHVVTAIAVINSFYRRFFVYKICELKL